MEVVVEFFKTLQLGLQLFLGKDQSGDSEVVSVRELAESAAWHQSNACVLENLQAVHQIHWLSLSSSCSDGLL
jgi:hypothetical protein